MKKRLLSALLILVMLIGVLSVSAFAVEDHEHYDDNGNCVCDFSGCTEVMHKDENGNHVCDNSGCTETVHTDANNNCVCDYVDCAVEMHEVVDGVCTKCYAHDVCVDADGNCVCDIRRCTVEMHEVVDGICTKCGAHDHVDANGNCICDIPGCLEEMHDVVDGVCSKCYAHNKHVDENGNCVCDVKGCEIAVHADSDKDGYCDNNCGTCLHTKKNGYCTKVDCKHKGCDTCGGAKPCVKTYTITAVDGKHGDITPEGKVTVDEGGSVTFRIKADKGYEIAAIYVDGKEIDGNGECRAHKCGCKDHKWVCKNHKWICNDDVFCNWIDWSDWYDCKDCKWWDCDWDYACHGSCYWVVSGNKITFKNIRGNHKLYVEFAPVKEDCPSAAYKDLDTTAWYHEATDFVIENGLMKGKSSTKFDPNGATTRGQLVTMLYRLAGEPAVSGESEFKDVAADQWYTDAVIWAAKKGIVTGYGDGLFGVEDVVTREQTVAILYRYAKYMKCDVSDLADLEAFLDAEDVSEYAEDAFGWAVEEEIVNGKPVGKKYELDPQGTTIRVEMAALLMRFAAYVD